MNKPIRHGEIMLVPVSDIPDGKKSKHTYFVVGHSETGHFHVLESESDIEVTEAKDDLYIRLFAPTKIMHKKEVDRHRDITIAPGLYKRYHDTEYDPFDKVIRSVKD